MGMNFSKTMTLIMRKCEERTRALNRFIIHPEDIVLSIVFEDYLKVTDYIIKSSQRQSKQILRDLRDNLKNRVKKTTKNSSPLVIFDITESENTRELFSQAKKISLGLQAKYIEPEHVIAALFASKKFDDIAVIFEEAGFNYSSFMSLLKKKKITPKKDGIIELNPDSNTPVADYLCNDLTMQAREGALDPALCREDEIQRIIQILGRRKKNNPVLIGKPGVGKTAIVEAIAMRIVNKKVPRVLLNKRLLSLDMGMMVAGTKYRGQFEERMKNFVKELETNQDIILFIDELHNIIGTGSAEGSMDAANMLKPQLSRGIFQSIGATTLKEYRRYIEKDGALERRFQTVHIKELSEEQTHVILSKIKSKYENYHNVKYTQDALANAVKLSQSYITDRVLPDKAIDVIDEAGSKISMHYSMGVTRKLGNLEDELKEAKKKKEYYASMGKYSQAGEMRDKQLDIQEEIDKLSDEKNSARDRLTVDTQIVKEVISLWTGVPVDRMTVEGKKDILNVQSNLNKAIVGQKHVIDVITRSLKLTMMGLKDSVKPRMSLLFIGPSGVGKTFIAKELARNLYSQSDSFMRFDMSEYSLEHEVDKLIGSPPGFVGYEEGGRLTEFVRRNPYSLLLFDEIEKAHPKVYNIFLQMLEEGQLTDSFHRMVDFRNTIVIFTSNVGTFKPGEYRNIGFSGSITEYDEKMRERLLEETKKQFRPEFLNRLDNVIVFNKLSKTSIEEIFRAHLDKMGEKYVRKGYSIEYTPEVPLFLTEQDYSEEYGARVVDRSIETNIESLITDLIIDSDFGKNKLLTIYVEDNELKTEVEDREEEKIETQEEI
ncbi:MAG: ATP-dependent Clp protease ATP-binding subunit [bacterium]